ncbi:ABC transporter ATP-binding protein [Virgibacillus phasianinus]|uniref:ABC transporter ATP-binding protein n=1 Tax=Virgibacillus phasianinus TaxID=2017483 RepID=A0A220U4J0_9BACI|nr:ABC transporter ATP-binding protein [Virgibacillus phasianinus]ASK63010.1 ABC transporter ATP-binding protein [Virgibacillus phasianinus]
MLNVTSLSKKYGKTRVLNSLSFMINPGEIVGLVGENGAGKSTLLNILASLSKPTSGSLSLHSIQFDKNIKKVRQMIGFVPQEIAIWEEFTVQENMVFFEKLSTVNKTTDELQQLCMDMNLDKWKEPVKHLSGGMKRKLNMAISLIHDPELLLLDEPTVGIDLKSKNEISSYLQQLAAEKNTMILFTSHDMDEIINVCDRVLCIGEDTFYQNILQEAGTTPEIF